MARKDSGKHAFSVIGGVGRSLGSREGEFEGERVERGRGHLDSGKHAFSVMEGGVRLWP